MQESHLKISVFNTIVCLLFISVMSVAQSEKTLNRHYTGFYSVYSSKHNTGTIKTFLSKMSDLKYKKRFWEEVKQRHEREANSCYIYQLVFGRGKYNIPEWDKARKLLDDFLKSTPEVTTYPELIFAVVPSEENVTWGGQIELLNKIYDYLKQQYKLTIYQWLTEPYPPRLDIKADGWILDAYGIQGEAYYRHLQKFILSGRPVVPILWAAEPGLGGYYKEGGVPSIIKNVGPKFEYCRELNLPVVLFACSKKLGSYSIWKNSEQAPFPELRKFFLEQLNQLSPVDPAVKMKHPVPVYNCSGDKTNSSITEIKFNQFNFVNHCLIKGVHNLRLGKDGLHFFSKQKQNASLTWHFKSSSSFISSSAQLYMTGNGKVKFEYSLDKHKWHVAQMNDNQELILNIPAAKDIYLRTKLTEGDVILSQITFTAKHKAVSEKSINLQGEKSPWFFEENFNSQKFIHHMDYKPIKQLIYKKGSIGIAGKKGYAVTWNATQKFIAPKAVKEVKLLVNCYANSRSWGGAVQIGISLDGENIIKEINTKTKNPKKTRFRLELKEVLPEASKSFYVHLMLRNGSGVFAKNVLAAIIYNYRIEAK